MITVLEAIEKRRSIRKYKEDQVPDDIILQLINCARLAPSSHNCQLARFVIVKDAILKTRLCEYAYQQPFIEKAPCVIVCCADLGVFTREIDPVRLEELETVNPAGHFDKTGKLPAEYYSTAELNTAIAIEHIMLAAVGFGLGTCWVRKIQPVKIHSLLGLPDEIMVVALMPIGYPAQDPPQRPRMPLEKYILTPP